ncbi:MAG: hypothetical protein DRJ97_00410 [Thermoprotei archaeon]|nr:MAG: hypothetical protein DRJ97_00410 [Thermoprotei archaeon]
MTVELVADPELWGELCRLFNSLKNSRRMTILSALLKRPLGLKDLQRQLWLKGLKHSLETVRSAYLQPLVDVGIVKLGSRAELTPMGRRIAEEALREAWLFRKLPSRSKCYEEALLISLLDGPKSISSIDFIKPQAVIYRSIGRLKGLIKATGRGSFYVALEGGEARLTPTEKRLLEDIKRRGGVVALRELMKDRFISRRRVYKYLARLREKKVVDKVLQGPEVELTDEGVKAARALWRVASYVAFKAEKARLKALIVSYLGRLGKRAFDDDLVDSLNHYFKQRFGRPIQPYEYDELKDELKREGIIEGDPYTGYRLKLYPSAEEVKSKDLEETFFELATL